MAVVYTEEKEHITKAGEAIVLSRVVEDNGNTVIEVNNWDKDGNNKWCRTFKTQEEAEIEYNRWLDY